MKHLISIAITLLFFSLSTYAHGDEEHNKKEKEEEQTQVIDSAKIATMDKHEHSEHDETSGFSINPNPGWNDFPSMHPFVVHFPIVLLLIATFFQFLSFFFHKEAFGMTTLLLLAGGVIGAYVASNFVHPHTAGLTEQAANILAEHEKFADWTVWLSISALIVKTISQFFWKEKRGLEIITIVLLAGASISVSLAGHHGAQLTHLEGVGPQGKFLETEAHDHEHTH